MAKNIDLQGKLLDSVIESRKTVTVFLTNGFQFDGRVLAYDNFTVLMMNGDKQNLVFKHAISTIVPHENIDGLFEGDYRSF